MLFLQITYDDSYSGKSHVRYRHFVQKLMHADSMDGPVAKSDKKNSKKREKNIYQLIIMLDS